MIDGQCDYNQLKGYLSNLADNSKFLRTWMAFPFLLDLADILYQRD
jgi:hypothetical protein